MKTVRIKVAGILDIGVIVDNEDRINLWVRVSDTQARKIIQNLKLVLDKKETSVIKEVK